MTDTATLTLTVTPVNDAPLANDDSLAATEDTPVTFAAADLLGNDSDVDGDMAATEDTPVTFAAADLLGNDSDVDGDSLSIASVTSGTGGSAVLNADGTVTFTPDADSRPR
ncbi:cadherin-like domain-containing protein [Pseudomonas stutzeri]|nr:cadherin-like domain-containing protein [Stutzerimonas stutzeri]